MPSIDIDYPMEGSDISLETPFIADGTLTDFVAEPTDLVCQLIDEDGDIAYQVTADSSSPWSEWTADFTGIAIAAGTYTIAISCEEADEQDQPGVTFVAANQPIVQMGPLPPPPPPPPAPPPPPGGAAGLPAHGAAPVKYSIHMTGSSRKAAAILCVAVSTDDPDVPLKNLHEPYLAKLNSSNGKWSCDFNVASPGVGKKLGVLALHINKKGKIRSQVLRRSKPWQV